MRRRLPSLFRKLIVAAGLLAAVALTVQEAPASSSRHLNRGGYLSVTLTPMLVESPLQGTSYMPILTEVFENRAADFGASLAEGLEKVAFAGRLIVLPDFRPEHHARFREKGQKDTFLVNIDLRTSYGLSDGSALAAMASGASCFLLSKLDMFRYQARTEATVTVHYFTPKGKPLRVLGRVYHVEDSVKGDFTQAMSMPREVEWISHLTSTTLEKVKRSILSELPQRLPERARRKAADYLDDPPSNEPSDRYAVENTGAGRPETPDRQPRQARSASTPRRDVPGGPLNLAEIARQTSPSICKIKAGGRTGSGFVLSRKGYVLTSLMIVEGAEKIGVRFHGQDEIPARLFQSDKDLGLAILTLADRPGLALTLDDGPPPIPESKAISFGFPEEAGLRIIPGRIGGMETREGERLLRIDADMPEGNVGGPVVDERGRCIGVVIRTYPDHALSVPARKIRQSFGHFLDPG